MKLPTLLEGEALTTWLDLSDNERKDYGIADHLNHILLHVFHPLQCLVDVRYHQVRPTHAGLLHLEHEADQVEAQCSLL